MVSGEPGNEGTKTASMRLKYELRPLLTISSRRSVDLEDEIRELRKQLETRNGAPGAVSEPGLVTPTNTTPWEMEMVSTMGALPVTSPCGNLAQTSRSRAFPPSIDGLASVSAAVSPTAGSNTVNTPLLRVSQPGQTSTRHVRVDQSAVPFRGPGRLGILCSLWMRSTSCLTCESFNPINPNKTDGVTDAWSLWY